MGTIIYSGRGIQDPWLIHAPHAAPAVPRYYVEFNGTTSNINCGSNATLQNIHAAAFTVDAWIRPHTTITLAGIVSKGDYGNARGWMFACETHHLNAVACFDAANAQSLSTDVISNNVWIHVTLAYNHSVDRKIYLAIDGNWCAYSLQDASSGVVSSDAGEVLYIGDIYEIDGLYYPFHGDISWVRISSGLRYTIGVNFTPPVRCAPPTVDGTTIELWTMDEGVGVTTAASINSPVNNGAMTNCIWQPCI